MFTQLIEWSDLIVYVRAGLIPALTAYVARTAGQRGLVPVAATVALAVITALVDGDVGFDLELVRLVIDLAAVQLLAYLGAWKPANKARAEAGRPPLFGTNDHGARVRAGADV